MRIRTDYKSYAGRRFGKLTVESVSQIDGKWRFYVKCTCGRHKLVEASNVLRGLTTSCGCCCHSLPNPNKLGSAVASEILKLRASGLSYGDIAKRLGISKTTCYNYCTANAETINQLRELFEQE